ncbi:MAG: S1 RNA-binding domain-containing protein [Ilumatobacteraceae bacterium]
MPNRPAHHVVVDGSNIATEGRSLPSLQQLDEAVRAFIETEPDALITVVVDATFGHRIDPKEVPAFDAAVAANELVAPPAGAVGRGDAFVLSIADKVKATILSNDSFQEFHGQYPWLFDEGRLVGGKPVPHIGWVFVNRLPVRGPLSRKSVADSKRRGRKGSAGGSAINEVRTGSVEASRPMPVPKAPPPGASLSKKGDSAPAPTKPSAPVEAAPRATEVNELIPFLTFVEHHPPGTSVSAVVDSYSSHGAYVTIGDVRGYVPLRLMADPAPRSAREYMKVGESVTLVVESFAPARRSIDLAVPAMATVTLPAPKPAKRSKKQAAMAPAEPVAAAAAAAVAAVTADLADVRTGQGSAVAADAAVGEPPAKRTRRTKKAAAATPGEGAPEAAAEPEAPTPKRRPRKQAAAEVASGAEPSTRRRASTAEVDPAPEPDAAPATRKRAPDVAAEPTAEAADAPATRNRAPAAVTGPAADAVPAPRKRVAKKAVAAADAGPVAEAAPRPRARRKAAAAPAEAASDAEPPAKRTRRKAAAAADA